LASGVDSLDLDTLGMHSLNDVHLDVTAACRQRSHL
jgi:hypothetical protein